MEICLYINTDYNDDLVTYPTRDFGYTTMDYEFIYPLDFSSELKVEYFSGNLEFWCVNVSRVDVPSKDETLRIFPIIRLVNYEDQKNEMFSHEAQSLSYTLGALYSFDIVFVLLFLFYVAKTIVKEKIPVPFVTWISILFLMVCIFRIAFCFHWPSGGFQGEPLTEYAIFEIPTFLLFSVLISTTGNWRKLSKKK